MAKLPRFSGEQVIKILCNQFHFMPFNSKGSHITLVNPNIPNPKPLAVYRHDELKVGSLIHIIEQAGISREQFLKAINN
jgi:predicted RNA binding protein YcfA (HicA-like mRNA interferase family)